MKSRAQILEQLKSGDSGLILIVGGGINGVGTLRDLAAQGIAATLVERGDFCSGTSSAPSRLIHGGLRYLEQGEFKLVRESVEERDTLLLNAPHQVHPLRVWVPALSWTGGTLQAMLRFLRLVRDPGPKGALILKFGLMFFDSFSWKHRTMPRHRLVRKKEARTALPGLSDEVKIIAEYYDARIESPERLTVELIEDAERDCDQSIALPYMSLQELVGDVAILRDELTGEVHRKTCAMVLNCAGAWIDHVNHHLGITKPLVGGTRGSHIVLNRPDLAAELADVMLYFETKDHRACLAYRINDDHILLGTTDLRTEDPDDRQITEDEINYLFEVLTSVMPHANLEWDDISYCFAGVRPLPHQTNGSAGAISRDHHFKTYEPEQKRPIPVVTLIGGKWTTYRACAAQLTDLVLKRFGKARQVSTESLPIGGGRDFPPTEELRRLFKLEVAAHANVSTERSDILFQRYGTRSKSVAKLLRTEGDVPLRSAPTYSWQEILWLLVHERVTQLDDLILRRSLLVFEGFASSALCREIAAIAAPVLHWDEAETERQISLTEQILEKIHLVKLNND